MNLAQSKDFFIRCESAFSQEMDRISDLDAAIGDGDHGVSMLKGFRAIKAQVTQKEYTEIGMMWMEAGKVFLTQVGGTCGPLFATFFMKGGMLAKGKTEVDLPLLAKMISTGVQGVMTLGKTQVGEKTMIDAMKPGADALEAAVATGAGEYDGLLSCVQAAKEGMESTAEMVATKGRGRYQGDNAKGHVDPGAMSATLIYTALADAVKEG